MGGKSLHSLLNFSFKSGSKLLISSSSFAHVIKYEKNLALRDSQMSVAPQELLILKILLSKGKSRNSKHSRKKDQDKFVSILCFKMKVGIDLMSLYMERKVIFSPLLQHPKEMQIVSSQFNFLCFD